MAKHVFDSPKVYICSPKGEYKSIELSKGDILVATIPATTVAYEWYTAAVRKYPHLEGVVRLEGDTLCVPGDPPEPHTTSSLTADLHWARSEGTYFSASEPRDPSDLSKKLPGWNIRVRSRDVLVRWRNDVA